MHVEDRQDSTGRGNTPEEGPKGEPRGHRRGGSTGEKAAFVPISLEYKAPASV